MHSQSLLIDLAIVLSVAAVVTVLFNKLKLPVVLGYIVAGFIISPNLLPFSVLHSRESIHTLSELGVVFLLFGLGLEFNLRKLKAASTASILAGLIEIGGMLVVGYLLGRLFGWNSQTCLFLGAALAISSTTIIVKVFTELGIKHEKFAEIVFGMLIVEDLAAVVLITLLSGVSTAHHTGAIQAFSTLGLLLVFLIVSVILGLLIIPRIVTSISDRKNNEILLISILGLCLGFCAIVSLMGYNVALGAFLMGTVISESTRAIGRIEKLMEPLRDLFCAVFFVSVGLMIEPEALTAHPWIILTTASVLILGKSTLCSFGAFLSGRDLSSSLKAGMSMTQIGEFSYVIALLAASQGEAGRALFSIVVGVSVVTTLLTPFLIRSADTLTRGFLKFAPDVLLTYIDLYYRWTVRFAERTQSSAARKILRRITVQLTIFTCLIAGAFLTALFLTRFIPALFPVPARYIPWIASGLWLLALMGSMPVILAAFRKLRALGLILAELGISENIAGKYFQEIRAVLSSLFFLLGAGLVLLYGGILSYAILPRGPLLGLLCVTAAVSAFFLRSSFNRIYFQGKAAIAENFSEDSLKEAGGVSAEPQAEAKRAETFSGSRLLLIEVGADSPISGKTIGQTGLRSTTGVSILAVEKADGLTMNPGADELLKSGDRVMVLGGNAELAEAYLQFIPPGGNAAPAEEISLINTGPADHSPSGKLKVPESGFLKPDEEV